MNSKRLNLIYGLEVLIVFLVVVGILPRVVGLGLSIGLIIYFLLAPLEELVIFFVRSIPLFIALPLTQNFDSLTSWRIFSLVLFARWIDRAKIKAFFQFKNRPVYATLLILLTFTLLSFFSATSLTLACRRLIFLINLSLIGPILYQLLQRQAIKTKEVINAIMWPTLLVTAVGFLQLISTYLLDIFQFMDFWAGRVEQNLFGRAWAEIAYKANTWFAYFGDRISLRMFSIFPDSHSFPIFLLLGLPAVIALSIDNIVERANNFRAMLKTRGRLRVVWVPAVFLAVILSGTRGMWLAGVVSGVLALGYWLLFKKQKLITFKLAVFKYISAYLLTFILLFAVAYPIFASPQFEFSRAGAGLAKRLHSIIDLAETSNARRIQIWKDSLRSIVQRPWLGVGLGNFPIVVQEDLAKAKAGSSAHNLYLHIAAELGIPALLAVLYFLWLLLAKLYRNYWQEKHAVELIYFGMLLITLPWLWLYSFTDIAIFDERTFLLLVVTSALIFGQKYEIRD